MRSLTPFVVSAVIALVGALTWVYYKVEQHACGNQIKALERELAALNAQNDALSPKIAMLSSRATLQRRLNEGMVKMTPIDQSHIIAINALRRSDGGSANEMRAVSNEGINR